MPRRFLQDLEQAQNFIFLEYFILGEGKMWNAVLDILERKVGEGVEVRLIYDDVGSVFILPKNYHVMLEKKGIKCEAFNKLIPFMSLILNNRDHRKIVVIDGKIGYTGGINMADEYINETHPYGDRWKDAGIRIEGEAVWNFTVMFLQMWNIDEKNCDFDTFLNVPTIPQKEAVGYVVPYADCPLDNDQDSDRSYAPFLVTFPPPTFSLQLSLFLF